VQQLFDKTKSGRRGIRFATGMALAGLGRPWQALAHWWLFAFQGWIVGSRSQSGCPA